MDDRLPFLSDTQASLVAAPFTLLQLSYFVAAIETGSFTAAARLLGVSQPAVAEQIQRLERGVGQSLFARKARGVNPTRAGADLAVHANRVLAASREAMASIADDNTVGRGTVAFGTFGTPHHFAISQLIARFVEDYPDVSVAVVGRNSSTTAEAVRSGALDAGLVVLPVDDTGLDVRPQFNAEVFYVSANETRTRRPVRVEALADRDLILYEAYFGVDDPSRQQLWARAQAAGFQLSARIEVEFAETALELAAAGVGDTYAPGVLIPTLDRRLHACSFSPPLVDSFALITRTGARLSRPMLDFIERVRHHFAQVMTPPARTAPST
jgi:DNA-binding transcriptional LysR family regulator